MGLFTVSTQADLPIIVRIDRGSVYTATVAFGVSAHRQGSVAIDQVWGWSFLDEGGQQEVMLEQECLNRLCPGLEHCQAGQCVPHNLPAVYTDASYADSLPCWEIPEQ